MGAIVPAILPHSKNELIEQLDRFASLADIDAVQIDVIDGRFASPPDWPYAGKAGEFARMVADGELLPHADRFKYDIDLMVTDPELVTGSWLALGASRITVHAESTSYLPRVITDLKHKYGHDKDFAPDLISFGLAINIATDLGLIEQFVSDIDYVQFTGAATLGKPGQPFDRRVLKRIESFRKRHPDMTLQADGGVTLTSAPELLAAGVDRLIVDSAALAPATFAQDFRKFLALAERYGTYER